MHLTDRAIQRAKADKDIFLNDGHGLYLRVRASGSKIWLHRYKPEGTSSTRWFEIGTYPDLKLAEARLENQKLRAQRRTGSDPVKAKLQAIAQKAEQEALDAARLTVQQLFDKWFEKEVSEHKDGGAAVKRLFERDVLPIIGALPAVEASKQHVNQVVDAITDRGANRMARVALSLIRQMFRYGQDRDLIDNDPTATIRKAKTGTPDVPRDRVLNEREIVQLAEKLPAAGLTKQAQLAIWIILGTCCRVGELLQARWSDIDLSARQWTIPAQNSKNGIEHTIYISDFVLTQFEELHKISGTSTWCYPDKSGDSHVSTKSLTKQFMDRQREPSAQLKGRSNNTKALALDRGVWKSHDLRRTGATMMAKLGVLPDIIDRCLNHKQTDKIKATYQLYSYEAEQIEAWTALGKRLEVLTSSEHNVLVGTFGQVA